VRLIRGDELNRLVAECAAPCRAGGPPPGDLVGAYAGEKGLLWLGEPNAHPEAHQSEGPAGIFTHLDVALAVSRLAGVGEDELVFSVLPRCAGTLSAGPELDAAMACCLPYLVKRLRQPQTPPTIVTLGRTALTGALAAVKLATGEEPAVTTFGGEETFPAESMPGANLAELGGRVYFTAREFRVVPVPPGFTGGLEPVVAGRHLAEFAANLSRLCRVSLYEAAVERAREIVPLAFREKIDATGSTYFTPTNRRLFRILRRPREVVAEFYSTEGPGCYLYRGADLEHLVELVLEALTQAIG
jgi:hypothetical protein